MCFGSDDGSLGRHHPPGSVNNFDYPMAPHLVANAFRVNAAENARAQAPGHLNAIRRHGPLRGQYHGHFRHPDDLAPGAELPPGEGIYDDNYGGAPIGSDLWPQEGLGGGWARARPPTGMRYYLDEPGAVDKVGWGWTPWPDGFANYVERQVAARNDWLEERQRNWRNLPAGRVQPPPGEGPARKEATANEVPGNGAARNPAREVGQWGFVLHDNHDDEIDEDIDEEAERRPNHPTRGAGAQHTVRGRLGVGGRSVGHGGHPGQGGMAMGSSGTGRGGHPTKPMRRQQVGEIQPGQRDHITAARGQRGARFARNEPEPNEAVSDDQSSVAGDSVITPWRPKRRQAQSVAGEGAPREPRGQGIARPARAASIASGERRGRDRQEDIELREMSQGPVGGAGVRNHRGGMSGGFSPPGRGNHGFYPRPRDGRRGTRHS